MQTSTGGSTQLSDVSGSAIVANLADLTKLGASATWREARKRKRKRTVVGRGDSEAQRPWVGEAYLGFRGRIYPLSVHLPGLYQDPINKARKAIFWERWLGLQMFSNSMELV